MILAKFTCVEYFYFVSETIAPECIADHHFGTVTLCLLKISTFIAKTFPWWTSVYFCPNSLYHSTLEEMISQAD